MQSNVGLFSYGTACIAYLVLSASLLLAWRNRALSLSLITATAVTAVWAGTVAFSTLTPSPNVTLVQVLEVARNGFWLFLLLSIYGGRLQDNHHVFGDRRWLPWFIAGMAVICIALFAPPYPVQLLAVPEAFLLPIEYSMWLTMSLVGLLLLENIYRNSNDAGRSWAKFLCLGAGSIFLFDFFMYAGALLLQQLDPALWRSRGFVVALTAPLVGLAAARSRDGRGNVNLNRHVAFHTFTLLAAGTYLIIMAVVGYFVGYLGATWGAVLQVTFVVGAVILLIALLSSQRVRARSRVWLSKHFFSYKYDYRQEWLQFTETLEQGRDNRNTPEAIVEAMAQLGHCDAGLLWASRGESEYELIYEWHVAAAGKNVGDYTAFHHWLRDTAWVVDVKEWRESPGLYEGLQLPAELATAPGDWLVVPLMFSKGLEGFVVMRRLPPSTSLNWEDRDLLKVAGRQAASHLAQYRASEAVAELRQFEAFNRLSSYVAHDLKNILTEQSLIVSNAARHRGNPEFFDDVIATVGDSVERMTRLMSQMKSGNRGTDARAIELGAVLREVVAERAEPPPAPVLEPCEEPLMIQADRYQLATVLAHIINNAKEATDKHGQVTARLLREGGNAVIEVEDNGTGMSADFIKQRLFKPFDSTKGLTGMGIGMFESREVLRGLRGDITVESRVGEGSTFRIVLPCLQDEKK